MTAVKTENIADDRVARGLLTGLFAKLHDDNELNLIHIAKTGA